MSNPAYYIALDNETGGVTGDYSLLTTFLLILDKDFNVLDSLSLEVKPNDGLYKVTAQAMSVNKIDLIKHDKVAISYSQAGTTLFAFLNKHSNKGAIKLVPIGHNVGYDIDGLCKHITSKQVWNFNCSYRVLDTGVIAQYLRELGIIPTSVKGSLGSLVEHYGLGEFDSHTASGDVLATVNVLKKMLGK